MKKNNIDLTTFIPKGHVVVNTVNGELTMTTTRNSAFKNRYHGITLPYGNEFRVPSNIILPDKYKVPFCLKIKLKIDAPDLFILIGSGIISFGPFSTEHIKMLDISGVPYKKHHVFNNDIKMNEYFEFEVIYSFDFMQIKINDEVRYYSEDEIYMKSNTFPNLNNDGLEIKITCSKRSELIINECTVIEYGDDIFNAERYGNIEPEYFHYKQNIDKPDFNYCISKLLDDLRNEVIRTDEYVLRLKNLKLKRKIEIKSKCYSITYVSGYGFAYHINIDRYMLTHDMWWILYNAKREQQKYGGTQKRDLTTDTLNKLYETSPEFAGLMFDNLRDCTGCSAYCGAGNIYEFKNGLKKSCHGRMEFKMTPSDFVDVRKVIGVIDDIIIENVTKKDT